MLQSASKSVEDHETAIRGIEMAKKKVTKPAGIDVWEKNFAEIAAVRDRILAHFVPVIKKVRDDRDLLEVSWYEYYNMWNVVKDQNHYYEGMSNLFIPEVRKNVEDQTRQLTEAAFPNEDFFQVVPGQSGTKEGALAQKQMRMHQIRQSKLRRNYFKFNRQKCLYGTSVAYVPWTDKTRSVFKRVADADGKLVPKKTKVELFRGPDFVPKDLFLWYPLDARKEDFIESGCVELYSATRFDVLKKEKKGELWGAEQVLASAGNSLATDELNSIILRAEAADLPLDSQGQMGVADLSKDPVQKGDHVVALIFADIEMPEAVMDDEDPDLPVPMMIEIYNNNHVGLVKRNPFYHQTPPYVVGKYILPNANEFYGQGIPHAIKYMQYEINTKAEQGMDSATLALNPIIIIDPALAAGDADFEVSPGAKWFVPPQAVKLGQIPDTTSVAYQAINQLRSQITDFSDQSPVVPQQLAGKSRSATQADIVDRILQVTIKTFQLQDEMDVLEPLMEMWESLTDQHIEEDQVIMVLGSGSKDWKSKIIARNALIGNYRYIWHLSSQTANKTIAARQMIDLLKVINSIPPEERIKINFNYGEYISILWTELLNLPGKERIIPSPNREGQDPKIEHRMLELGMEIEVSPLDEDLAHGVEHIGLLESLKKKDPLRPKLEEHIQKHQESHQKKQRVQLQQLAILRQQEQLQLGQQQKSQGQRTSQGSGNRSQLSPNETVGDQGSGFRP